MGYNMSNDVALGQLGSGFHDTHSVTLTPPTGKVIIAITFLEDVELDVLTPELRTDATFRGPVDSGNGQGGAGTFGGTISAPVTEINSFGIATQTGANGANSAAVDSSNKFPKGLTIYGRWTAVSGNSAGINSTGGLIAYFGK